MRAAMEYQDRFAGALIMSAAGTDHKGSIAEAALRFDVWGAAKRLLECGDKIPQLFSQQEPATGDSPTIRRSLTD